MRFMNEWDIERAQQNRHPVKREAARIIRDLANLTNNVSDGWAYWPKPARAAAKLMAVIEDMPDPTEADLKKALAPIKSLLTRYAAQFNGQTIEFNRRAA